MGYHPVTLSFIRQDYWGMLAGSIAYDRTAISFEVRVLSGHAQLINNLRQAPVANLHDNAQ